MTTLVIALGGNALLRRGEPAEAAVQQRHIAEAATAIAAMAGYGKLVVTHGNGPQVGLLALQASAFKEVEPYPLDILGAESEGMIGYMIEQQLAGRIGDRQVATLLTLVEVDPDDPAFASPTKPIGAFYDKTAASHLKRQFGWSLVEQGGKWRRVVPSPAPKSILECSAIRYLTDANVVVVCAGGGGIPVVVEEGGGLRGVEAVVDKDRTAALLARQLDADFLAILTDVPAVYADWGEVRARAIRVSTPDRLREMTFEAGSMGPKVEAACDFVSRTGRVAAIGALDDGQGLLRGEAGTRIVPGHGVMDWY